MPEYSMHIGIKEESRACEDPGFDNLSMPGSNVTAGAAASGSEPGVPHQKGGTAKLENMILMSSDTVHAPIGPTSGEWAGPNATVKVRGVPSATSKEE